MPSWADGEDRRSREWRDEGSRRLATHLPKAAQYGASLPRVIEASPDHLECVYCGASYPWMDWWSKGGPDGYPTCPGCGEPAIGGTP